MFRPLDTTVLLRCSDNRRNWADSDRQARRFFHRARVLFLYVENEEEACFHGTPRLSSTIRERLLIDQERKGGKKRGLDLRAKGIYIVYSDRERFLFLTFTIR